ncbi:MAG: iron ABC transporter permease [Desulfurococcales archaeon]|nr:iron ABC transporter permease [Desulfurococcales archaeon]
MRSLLLSIFLLIGVVALSLVSLSIGPAGNLSPLDVARQLVTGNARPILHYRMLRTLAAIILGAGLASSGLTMQYALRNPMADPYLLGVSAGAAFGVVVVLSVSRNPNPLAMYLSGLAWGTIAFLIVVGLGAYMGAGPTSLIVAGVSVGYAFFGMIILMLARSPAAQRVNYTWLFGTVAYPTRITLWVTGAVVAASIALMVALAPRLYTLVLGDEVSASLGVNVGRLRLAAVSVSSAAASALVAMAGPVGFIGLAAPWAVRLAIGSRYLEALAGSTLLGMIAALGSDIAVRIVGGGAEIPLTAVTALFGSPVLFYLSRRTGW